MFYSPLFELYRSHKHWFNDFFIQLGLYWLVATLDRIARLKDFDRPTLSLLLFIIGFCGIRIAVKHFKRDKDFNTFGKHRLYYSGFFGVFSWINYMLIIRWRL